LFCRIGALYAATIFSCFVGLLLKRVLPERLARISRFY
jgi:hypothetical protein